MTITVQYGNLDNKVDVTEKVFLTTNSIAYIPRGDISRCLLFGTDPLFGVLKSVFVTVDSQTIEFDSSEDIYIDDKTEKIYTNSDVPSEILSKVVTVEQSNITYGHVDDEITSKIVSNKFTEENGSVTISYCLKNNEPVSDVSTDDFNYPLQSHKSELIPIELLKGYKEIDAKSWAILKHKTTCPYILVNKFSVPSEAVTCIINEISKNANLLLSETDLTPVNLQVWIKMKEVLNIKIDSPERTPRKRYVLSGNKYILKK